MRVAATGACWLLILVAQVAPAREEGRAQPAVDAGARGTSVVDRVVHDLCGKRVALLGEPPMHGFGRTLQFKVDVARLRPAFAEMGFAELPVSGAHAERLASLPPVHKDPFDRMLVAQSLAEPLVLLTNDGVLAGYGDVVKVV